MNTESQPPAEEWAIVAKATRRVALSAQQHRLIVSGFAEPDGPERFIRDARERAEESNLLEPLLPEGSAPEYGTSSGIALITASGPQGLASLLLEMYDRHDFRLATLTRVGTEQDFDALLEESSLDSQRVTATLAEPNPHPPHLEG